MAERADPETEEGESEEYRVTALELFFDLVFVFALTQVTSLVAQDLTGTGLLRGLAVLLAVWWSWVGFSWLTNSIPIEDDDRARLVMLIAMAAMLVLGLSIPNAFSGDGVLFGMTYLFVTLLFLLLYSVATRDMPEMNRAVRRLAPGVLLAPALIAIAGFFDAGVARASLWVVALAITFLAPIKAGTGGWQVKPAHFAERHGLIVIIALGESLVALGLAASSHGTTAVVVAAASLGVLVIGCLWWLYFDVVALVGEFRLTRLTGEERNALARDSYSYIHLLMIVGIVMLALGLKKVLTFANEAMSLAAAIALFGGVAVYLLGHVAFRWRNIRSVNVQRLVIAIVLVALIPVGTVTSAYVSLLVVATLTTGLVCYEAVRYRDQRQWIRSPH